MAKFRSDGIRRYATLDDAASDVYQLKEQLNYVLNHIERDNLTDNTWSELNPYDGSDKQDKSENLTEISQYGLTKPGKRFNAIPYVQSDGVMEIGSHLDFHGSSADTSDFTRRLFYDTNGFILGCTASGASTGVVGKVTRTAGSFGRNANIYGQCFCTCLGNGNFRFDLSGNWYVASSVTNHDYGISKDFLRRSVYNNIYGSTDNLVNLNYTAEGECLVFSAADYTYGHPNMDYSWIVQEQTYSYCLGRIYTTAGAVGGWEGNVVNTAFSSGFYFKATIWAALA